MQLILDYNTQLESYRYIFFFSLIVGTVFALLTILLCVIFRVDEVVGDITGAYRRKAIKKQKDESASGNVVRNRRNTKYSGRSYADSKSRELATTEELRLTEKFGTTAKLVQLGDTDETIQLSTLTDSGNETVVLASNTASDETVLLGSGNKDTDETTVLSVNKTDDEIAPSASSVVLEEDIVVSSANRFL